MDLNLFKEVKTRYLFLKMFSVIIAFVIMLVLYKKILGGTLRDDHIDFCAGIITLLFFILILQFIRQNNS